MSHSFGGVSGSGSARFVNETKRSSSLLHDLSGGRKRVVGRDRAVRLDLDGQAVEIDALPDARVVDREVHLANRRKDRIERDQADHVLDVALAVGHHVAAPLLDADLHRELGVFRRERAQAIARIENLDVGVGDDVGRGHVARAAHRERQYLRLVAVELDRQALEVEHQRDRIFDHPGNRRELVKHAVDLHVGDGGPGNRAEQHAPQRVAKRDSKAALERLDHELGVVVAALANFDGCADRRFQHGGHVVSFVLCCRLRYPPVDPR